MNVYFIGIWGTKKNLKNIYKVNVQLQGQAKKSREI